MVTSVLKTVAVVVGIVVLFAAVFMLQIETGIGPAGAMTKAAAGSREWFAVAHRWVAAEKYLVWPCLVVIGAVIQRLWCPLLPSWTAAFVALPAIVANVGADWNDIVLCAGYAALAMFVGRFMQIRIDRESTRKG